MDWDALKQNTTLTSKIIKNRRVIKPLAKNLTHHKSQPKVKIEQPLDEVLPRILHDKKSLDKNLIKKINKNNIKADLILDLHGLNQEEAYEYFLENFYFALQRGYGVILIITGKGLVLRESLAYWLREPKFANKIYYFCQAHQDSGGGGAFYLFLHRR